MPKDLGLKFPLQPRLMKLTMSQCREGSGFLNGSWRQVRNHEILLVQVTVVSIVVMSFPQPKNKQNEVGEAMRSSSKQNESTKLWDIPDMTLFITNLSLCGQLHWAWPKRAIWSLILWQKTSEFTLLGLKTFSDVKEIPKPKKTFLAIWTL